MILLPNPNASREDYIDGLKLTESEFKIIASMDERSRRFLIKQGHDSSVCQLNLRGMDDALAVISASTDNIEILHQILNQRAAAEGVSSVNELRPEQWLQDFYDQRKGSGKDPRARQQTSTRAQGQARQHKTQAPQRALASGDDDGEDGGGTRKPPPGLAPPILTHRASDNGSAPV